MTITCFYGEKSGGKTISMSKEAYCRYKQGQKIYSNYHLSFPHTIITVNDLIEFAENGLYFGNTTFCLDELHLWFNARRSGKKRNIIFNFFLTQSAKNDCDVLYTTQYTRQVDILIRINTEISCKSYSKSLVWEYNNSKPKLYKNWRPKNNINYFKIKTWVYNHIIKFEEDRDVVINKMYYANPYFKLYNTREVIKQQKDVFEEAIKLFKENKGVVREHITTKQKRSEQHNNRLFHEANEKMLMGGQ
jgi:hypothetical protein